VVVGQLAPGEWQACYSGKPKIGGHVFGLEDLGHVDVVFVQCVDAFKENDRGSVKGTLANSVVSTSVQVK
jgi:hypothetical protein